MQCRSCGATLSSDALFCSRCGSRVSATNRDLFCPRCGSHNPAGATQCQRCFYELVGLFAAGGAFEVCPGCGTENPPGAIFCIGCGDRRKLDVLPRGTPVEGGGTLAVRQDRAQRLPVHRQGDRVTVIDNTPNQDRGKVGIRLATTIIALGSMLVVGLQSCAASAAGSLSANKALSDGGSDGLVVALLLLVGGAFAFGQPLISFSVFVFAGVVGLAAGGSTAYTDLTVWGIVCFVLALMSALGRRERNRSVVR